MAICTLERFSPRDQMPQQLQSGVEDLEDPGEPLDFSWEAEKAEFGCQHRDELRLSGLATST